MATSRPRSRRCGSAPTTSSRSRSRPSVSSKSCGARAKSARSWSRTGACAAPSASRSSVRASSACRRRPKTLRAAVAELAGTDVSVILYGETGVGKDLVARCLHDFGRRHKANYVAVNCAAVPDTMVESEFFGHEAGAFTSASKARAGKLEHASGGTLFLDEIDSMPLCDPGQAPARAAGAGHRAARFEPQHPGQSAPDRGEQDRSAQGERRGQIPARPLLPAFGRRARRSRRCASASRTFRCCSNISPRRRRPAHGREPAPDSVGHHEHADGA